LLFKTGKHCCFPSKIILFLVTLFTLISFSQASFGLTLEEESKVGKDLYEKLEKSNILFKNTRINEYVTLVGNKVLNQTHQTLFDFQFSIIDSQAINAFATPGGYVYVNKGLINILENESELAGVLAHEISHITARHIARQMEKSQTLNMATLAAILAGAILGGGGQGTEAVLGLSLATATTLQLKYSRENEEEADRLGMTALTGAGYDAKGMLNLLKIMKNFEFYSNSIPSYFLTHPGTDERIHYIDGLLQTRYKSKGARSIIGGLSRIQTLILLSDKENMDSAQKQFESNLKKNPNNLDAIYGMAVIQSRLGKKDESIRLFTKAQRLAPNDLDVLRGIGMDYFNSGNMNQAIVYLEQAHKINDRDEDTILYLARANEEVGNFTLAIKLYQDLHKLRPDDITLHYHIGMNLGKTGDQGESHYQFGLFNKNKEKMDSALFHFKEALKYFPAGSARYSEIQKEIENLKPQNKAFPPHKRKFEF
jgi:predicted Zn-dependent protease